jgi:hypothetical protein
LELNHAKLHEKAEETAEQTAPKFADWVKKNPLLRKKSSKRLN